jgi:hypothetical protein
VHNIQYKNYLKERENLQVLESSVGFAIYRQEQHALFLQDFYIAPEHRRSRHTSDLLLQVEQIAAKNGNKILYTLCDPAAAGSTISLKACLKRGFVLSHCAQNVVYLKKELSHG